MAGPAYPSTHRERNQTVEAAGEYNKVTLLSGSLTQEFTGASGFPAGAAILAHESGINDAKFQLTHGGTISSSAFAVDTVYPIGVRKVVQTTGYVYILHR